MPGQKLIILSGSPCVGKSAVADRLLESYENCAYLDGDWCWCVNPFSLSDPRLRNGDRSMSFVLSNYLSSSFDYVIFASVVAMYESIREPILRGITAEHYDVIGFTLTCTEETLRARHKKRGDKGEASMFWLRLPPYPGDHVIHTDGKTIDRIAAEIKGVVDAANHKTP